MTLSTSLCGHAQCLVKDFFNFHETFCGPIKCKKLFYFECFALYHKVPPLDPIPRADKKNLKSMLPKALQSIFDGSY